MFRCFVCKLTCSTVNDLIRHLKLSHAFYPGRRLQLVCNQDDCCLRFVSYSGFRKHLQRRHNSELSDMSLFESSPAPSVESGPASVTQPSNLVSGNPGTSSNTDERKLRTQEMCASVIAKLQSSGVASNVITSVAENMEELVSELHSNIREDIVQLVSDDHRSDVEEYFDHLDNPFSNFTTETKWKKYFFENWGVVEPIEIPLGVRYDSRRNRTTGTYDQVPITDKFVYVPLLQTLKFMFKNVEIQKHFVQPSENGEILREFCDGSYFKEHPLFSKEQNSLQIQLFYDDFETSNPLGSKHGIHKIGSIYFVLRNLSSKVNSALMNIHLLALFHTQDVKRYGFNAILDPIVRDFKILETSGITLPISEDPVHGTIAQVTGDNLGMHTLFGFVESFNSNYFCRFCLIDKCASQNIFSDDHPDIILRDRLLHAQHCQSLFSDAGPQSSFGVKKTCLLNELQYFNISDNFAFDIMHDILEGVGQLEMKLLFNHLSHSSIISSQSASNRIYSFNYGFVERKNRPTMINFEQAGNGLGLNAIQTFCLIRNLPLIFGDLVEVGDKHWSLLLLLLQIINIVFSPVISEGMTIYLKHLICEHHTLFKELYPRNLIPKHHFMTHYSRCIRKIGPLVHVWGMRYEAKHRFFKKSVKNFKNITKSLALKHQMCIAYHWESQPFKNIDCGPTTSVQICDLIDCELIAERLQIDNESNVDHLSWITCFGTEYRSGLFVCSDLRDDIPVFSKITDIIAFDSQYFLLTCEFETVCFVEHLHSFKVKEELCRKVSLLNVETLRFFKPFDLQISYGLEENDFYIVPVHVFI